MGIPGFLSRMRQYGFDRTIGRIESQEPEQSTVAVVDGPSLAHFLFQSTRSVEISYSTVVAQFDYVEIGKAAITWLDRLQTFAFDIEGVYFDGSLPSHKKQTRIERLQRDVDNLVNFKKISDRIEKATRGSGLKRPSDSTLGWHKVARREIPPPPFIVFAVYEALSESDYAHRTIVVDSEADTFCAAAALKASVDSPSRPITIFTNDSDLMIYDSGPLTRVVMINQVEERDSNNGRVLHGFEFWPANLRTMVEPSLSDLIQPAFNMQDPHISFKDALEGVQSRPTTDEFLNFADTYDTSSANVESLKRSRREGTADCQFDSRVSELIVQVTTEVLRLLDAKDKLKDVGRALVQDRRDLSEVGIDLGGTPPDLAPRQLDMYLPVLLEDPSRASAWKLGEIFRAAAVSLLLYGYAFDSPILEYKRSGHFVVGTEIMKPTKVILDERLLAWNQYIREELQVERHLTGTNRWRFLMMQLVLSDMKHAGLALPDAKEVVGVLSGDELSTWRLVHFSAQYQAEYWSIRMLKQVLNHLNLKGMTSVRGQMSSVKGLDGLLKGLPNIAEIFGGNHQDEGMVRWEILAENCLRLLK